MQGTGWSSCGLIRARPRPSSARCWSAWPNGMAFRKKTSATPSTAMPTTCSPTLSIRWSGILSMKAKNERAVIREPAGSTRHSVSLPSGINPYGLLFSRMFSFCSHGRTVVDRPGAGEKQGGTTGNVCIGGPSRRLADAPAARHLVQSLPASRAHPARARRRARGRSCAASTRCRFRCTKCGRRAFTTHLFREQRHVRRFMAEYR